jgi:hypothetical protein
MEWEEQGSSAGLWLPEQPGEYIEGEVLEIREGKYGKQYLIRNEENAQYLTPSHKALVAKLTSIKVADVVKIQYLGTQPSKVGQATRIYKVFKQKSVTSEEVL